MGFKGIQGFYWPLIGHRPVQAYFTYDTNGEAGDLRHYRAHYDVTVQISLTMGQLLQCQSSNPDEYGLKHRCKYAKNTRVHKK